jgi:gluconolactonase
VNGRLFTVIEPGMPDGFRVDVNGYLFISSADSIQVYTPQGQQLGKILMPERVGNCTFGGPAKDRLFIVVRSSLYLIDLNTKGVQQP